MRKAAADRNQPQIVAALRDIGATVISLHRVGEGCPDLLVGYHNINYLIEVKDGEKVPSKRKLTPQQIALHATWRGKIHIAENVNDAINIITQKLK